MEEKEFRISELLMLKLEQDPEYKVWKTVIYVGGRLFDQCKRLRIKLRDGDDLRNDEFHSIDQIVDRTLNARDRVHIFMAPPTHIYSIPPRDEFWGHCSTLQAWYEEGYNTRFLHRTLAFPLLMELAKAGDPKAKSVLQDEILSRARCGYWPVVSYISILVKEHEQCLDETGKDEFTRLLEELATHEDRSFRVIAGHNPLTPRKALLPLLDDIEKSVRAHAAVNENFPLDLVGELSRGKLEILRKEANFRRDKKKKMFEWMKRENIARNKQTPTDVLEMLSKDDQALVRTSVAGNGNAPLKILAILAKDPEVSVRSAVGRNSSTPLEALEMLAKDPEVSVRSAVGKNAKIPPAMLERLAMSDDERVRIAVGRNKITPPNILEVLAKDRAVSVRSAVGRNENTPLETLDRLAKDGEEWVRRVVGMNPRSPQELLQHLADDEIKYVRESVGKNESTPVWLLEKLSNDDELVVRMAAANNNNAPLHVLERLVDEMIDYYTDPYAKVVIEKRKREAWRKIMRKRIQSIREKRIG
ncbi:MAG: hypothetical protein ACFFCS_03715 [Candidatus Hodarchaeota archaeon]